MSTVEHYRAELRRVIEGRPWIVALNILAGAAAPVKALKGLGASRVMVVAAYRGAGPVPDPDEVPTVVLDLPPAGLMEAIHQGLEAMADLPESAREAIDAFDPDGEAQVVAALFADDRPVGGRPIWGGRPAAWRALEDKTIVDDLWDAAGVPRARSAVVPVALDALRAAAAELDLGDGTVWAADNREGFHGAASGLRWVRDPEGQEGADAAAFLAERADRARVMPFIEGVPCSIHGWVFDEQTVALRPCEMVIFRGSGAALTYARAATFWDPPPADREVMRGVARTVGDHLRATVGYRGVFTVDGIMGAEGFVPTELNPRYGAAIGVMAQALPDLPVYLLHLATAAGEALDYQPAALERLLVGVADAHRQAGCARISPTALDTTLNGLLIGDGEGMRVVASSDEPEDALGTVMAGPHAAGAFVRILFDPQRATIGEAFAPRAVQALRAVEEAWGLEMDEMTAAPDVRRER